MESFKKGIAIVFAGGFLALCIMSLAYPQGAVTLVNCVAGCSASSGGNAVFGPTANGQAAANPPVIVGGTSDGTGTGTVGNLQVVNGVASVTFAASAAGGQSTTGNIAANNTTAVVVKASAGTLYGVQVYGIGSAPAYLKIYNAASATCGSGTPVKRLMIPAAATAANGAGSNISFGTNGVAFGTGITYCVTTGITDADITAPAASTFLVNIDWK